MQKIEIDPDQVNDRDKNPLKHFKLYDIIERDLES